MVFIYRNKLHIIGDKLSLRENRQPTSTVNVRISLRRHVGLRNFQHTKC